jgi:23S rRNA (uracil1939-C5)-methyltransferase
VEQLKIKFTGLAYPGRAFGRDDSGRMIFAPFGLPDESVMIEVVESHKHWALGQIVEILEPSPERIVPRCIHYTQCGGCHYQHIAYERQLEVKREMVRSQLERLGDFKSLPVDPTFPSPTPWHYRNHTQFSLDPHGRLGFHAPHSNVVIPIRECHLPDEPCSDLWPRLDLKGTQGLERVSIRSGIDETRMVVFHGKTEPDFEFEIDIPASAIWLSPGGLIVLAGGSHLIIEVLGRPFHISAGSFFQVNRWLTDQLVLQALTLLEPQSRETIFDLYAGVGLFSAFIAETGSRILAVEESPWATEDFVINLDEFDSVELYEAPVELTLSSINVQPDGVLVDPPRAGLGREVVGRLLELSPRRLVYVSCDPATLARDAKDLVAGGYRLEKIIPLDLFPQTYHIETISLFRR